MKRGRWKDAKSYLTKEGITSKFKKLTKRILGIEDKEGHVGAKAIAEMKEGRSGDPREFKAFFARCKKNPNPRSVEQLFEFLRYIKAPFNKDGTFLAYKSVRHDFFDHHSGTFDNHPGKEPCMRREDVTFDPHEACSRGLHIGSHSYAAHTMTKGRLVVCEVDPENVVSVPKDYECQKMRVCRYKVIKEIPY